MAHCMDGQLQPIPDADLRVDARQLVLDRLLAHSKAGRNLLIGGAAGENTHHLLFSPG